MYSKYHGCGNDFILGLWQEGIDYSSFALKYCNRYTGVGADGLILAKDCGDLYGMVFYNADGSLAPMCGNGIRCLAAFLRDNKLVSSNNIQINTLSGIRTVRYEKGLIEVDMGYGDYDCKKLDIRNDYKTPFIQKKMIYKKNDFIKEYIVSAVYMTTHHLVIEVDDLDISDEIGEFFCKNEIFTKGINVNFVQIIDKDTICVKTYERGVGWTKACGSGSCASFQILNEEKKISNQVKVILEYGQLELRLDLYKSIKEKNIVMKGPAIKICELLIK